MLEAKHLTKTFGDLVAVNDVSFTVEPATIMGMIGQNGSGKTTIFRMLLDFLHPEKGGTVTWNGMPVSNQVRNIVGYLPEERGLYENMTIQDQVIYFARLRGMERDEIIERLEFWMEKFAVKGKVTDKIKTLSKGNQQKVQVIGTLIHEPKLLILDEPFSGLDPVNAELLQNGIMELKSKGSSIIFSSHNMNNVEAMCDKLLMIHNGNKVLYGGVHEVRESFGRTRLFIETEDFTLEELKALPGVTSVTEEYPNNYVLHLEDASYGKELYQIITKGQYIAKFVQLPPTLEEIFKTKAGEHHE
ncbi:sodium ABC transporter ATP-binding protein [Falseniella ignava]|uniref:Sodium ABC transporter ATP-binding protein n=1 Tax=Falseniella ignava TaxID=137730 RepID=A0A2I1K3W1_9LACT|nr:ABC transporter ATP-binding protein [Falseniella ignava]PKY90323.1 sodium ABC transporter ATP-binding protein [Falseniella ignava]